MESLHGFRYGQIVFKNPPDKNFLTLQDYIGLKLHVHVGVPVLTFHYPGPPLMEQHRSLV